MGEASIITLTILLVLIVAILVLGGLVLSGRAYTQLTALIASIGSLLEALITEHPQAQITSSTETEHNTGSARPDIIPTTPEKVD